MLSWLLGEPRSPAVREALASAGLILTSDLTLIECDRVVFRAMTERRLTEADAAGRRGKLRQVSRHWTLLRLTEEIVDRARRPFPVEPVRTLDAIHLAAATVAGTLVPGTAILSLDEGIRGCVEELGLGVVP